jgi:hypothetical protein
LQYFLDNWQYILQDAIQSAMGSGMMSMMGLQSQINAIGQQGVIDGQRQANTAHAVGNINQSTNMARSSIVCATAKGNQAKAAGLRTMQNMGQAIQSYEQAVNAGANASAGSPASASTEVNDLCQLGFLSTSATGRYGLLPSNKGCKDPAAQINPPSPGKYFDADMRISSVIDQLQFPLPEGDHVKITNDGHVSFIGSNGAVSAQPTLTSSGTPDGLGTEMDFAAAYKFCEHLMPVIPTPTHNSGTPTADDNVNIAMDRDQTSLRTAAADECFRALWYRTACPSNTQNTLKDASGGPNNCYQTQMAMCGRLVWAPPIGLGLSMKNHDPRFSNVLASCSAAVGAAPPAPDPNGNYVFPNAPNFRGLSVAMFEAIIAHKCDDPGYASTLADVKGNAAELEQEEQFDCPRQETYYLAKMERERQRLAREVRNAISLQGMGEEAPSRIAK